MGPKAMKKGLVSYQTKQRRWAILIICYISKQWCFQMRFAKKKNIF